MAPSGYIELANSVPYIHRDSKFTGETGAGRRLEITLAVRRKKDLPDLSALDRLPPTQRRYLTHAELEEMYGPDPDTTARVREFAKANNLAIKTPEPGAANLRLAGTVENLNKAFRLRPKLRNYVHPAFGRHHAHVGPISIPRGLDGDITGIFGFCNQRCLRRDRTDASRAASTAGRSRSWFWPTELAKIYNFPDVDRQTETVGLLEFGGAVERNDLISYFRKIHTAPPSLRIRRVSRVTADFRADPAMIREVTLDIEVVGALCPGARIAVYFSRFDEKGLIDALGAVITDKVKPSVVSISWGYSENQPFQDGVRWSRPAMEHVNHSLLAAALLGITVCAATGDFGSGAGIPDRRAHVWFPATSPYVLAVGGTSLRARSGPGRRGVKEIVWNSGRGRATGGGVSDVTPRPTWQAGIVQTSINRGHHAGRAIPDVAADADRATGYRVMYGGKLHVSGGTSAAAPLWASLIARLNIRLGARIGNINALLYTRYGPAGVLRDIVAGNNDSSGMLRGRFRAAKGWDAASGWGAPDGGKLLAAVQSNRPALAITTAPTAGLGATART